MTKGLVAQVSTTVGASRKEVWDALVNPAAVKHYMFGTDVVSTWREGAAIVWKGEWKGNPYEDKGTLRRVEPEVRLEYTHFSPLAGRPDAPENYHTITIELTDDPAHPGTGTRISLSQDNNSSEQSRQHSQENWSNVLAGLKKYLDRG